MLAGHACSGVGHTLEKSVNSPGAGVAHVGAHLTGLK